MTNIQDKNEVEPGVHVVYKKLGQTPLQALVDFKKEHVAEHRADAETHFTYAGRLDPLAEGLLVLLSGEAVHRKEEYTSLSKTYVCEVLYGFETDTLDVLGVVEKTAEKDVSEKEVEEVLSQSLGSFEEEYPVFSSKTVQGKPLFMWAREGKLSDINIPSHTVSLTAAELVSRRFVAGSDLGAEIKEKIYSVSGDFRQEEVLKKWEEVLRGKESLQFCIDTLSLSVSSGFYVRQFIKDLGKRVGIPTTTFHIKRTRVGDFHI